MYKYISFVRILREPIEIKRALDVTRKWLGRSNIKMAFYITHEISQRGLPHIHALLIVKGDEDKWALSTYIKAHRLCSYIDGEKEIPTFAGAQKYYKYICKQQPKNAEMYRDFLRNDYYNFRFEKILDTDLVKNKIKIEEEDIFIDI